MNNVHDAVNMIGEYYGDRTTNRSKMPLINHIHEGLAILEALDAIPETQMAYCLHPMFQGDEDLKANEYLLYGSKKIPSLVIVYIMEYRNIANAYLSFHHEGYMNRFWKDSFEPPPTIKLSPLPEVNQMLVADKVQNYVDFRRFHYGLHPKSDVLESYFQAWLIRLGHPEMVNWIQTDADDVSQYMRIKGLNKLRSVLSRG